MGSDTTAVAIWLGIVGRDAEFPGPGIVAIILIERAILLAGDQNMLDWIGTIARYLCSGTAHGNYARVKRQGGPGKQAEMAQHVTPGLRFTKPLL